MANRQPQITGYYARTKAQTLIFDSRYPIDVIDSFKAFLLRFKNYNFLTMDLTEIPELGNVSVDNGIGYFQLASSLGDRPISGFCYWIGQSQIDPSDSQTLLYPAFVCVQPPILDTMIHEWGHGIGLGHEDNNYRWIRHRKKWRSEQSYFFGNITGGGFMAYGGSAFNAADEFAVRHKLDPAFPAARIRGCIRAGDQFLKGANLILIDTQRTFPSSIKPLPIRHSCIIDMLGTGNGSFDLFVPAGIYKVMLVPINNYSRGTHGVWKLADSQIASIAEPLFLNGKRARFMTNPPVQGVLNLTNGQDLQFDWRIF